MVCFLERLSLTVPAREAVSAISPHASVLAVAGGRAWITISGDSRDHWLNAGDSLQVPASRPVVIEAERGTVAVEFTEVADAPMHLLRRCGRLFLSRLQALLPPLLSPCFAWRARPARRNERGSLCGGAL